MKIRKIRLQNFKRFDSYELDLTDPLTGQPRDLTVLVGENGSGKTTLLQAIALPLAVATKRIDHPEDFHWPGFLLDRLDPLKTRIEMEVEFAADELETTATLAEELYRQGAFESIKDDYKPPAKITPVTLFYKQGWVDCSSREEFYQFRGRDYAKQFVRTRGFEPFRKVGGVFWYDQERKATSLTRENSEPPTIDALRSELINLWGFHVSVRYGKRTLPPGSPDLYEELDSRYQAVFRPRRFVGGEPKPMIGSEGIEPDFWFMLDDGRRYYELDEMSSGERAVFPILFDFVKWRINRSVILIDEIELHLHPPLQQFLVESLPKLGEDNQFIITTHSEEVLNVLRQNVVHRLRNWGMAATKVLFCEGRFDAVVLGAVCSGLGAVIRPVGGKYNLRAYVEGYRQGRAVSYVAIRDRDFEREPDSSDPDLYDEGERFFIWGRHEIENYLIEPSVLASVYERARPWPDLVGLPARDESEIVSCLRQAAEHICYFQAARWALGQLPPLAGWPRLRTRWTNEAQLPDLTETACRQAACDEAADY